MDNTEIDEVTQTNALILANAGEIGALVICSIAGNDISNTLQDNTITKDRMSMLVMGKLTEKLQK